MPIIAAAVESNGWVLRLDVTGSLTAPSTDFGAYPLTPDGTPRVSLALQSPGFVKSGGTAVAGSLSRALVGTRALRLPVDPLNPNVQQLDETDLGGGIIRVRIALSEEVYAGDTGLTLAVLAGWRAGEGAASGISVANNSAVAPPLPVFRWVLPPYETTAGTFRASLIVGTVHPLGFEPCAGVRFTCTNGTNTQTIWATALGTDNTYGDNLRCYTVEFDPAAAPAMTAGMLRIDAEVYPWLGAMRTTDPAGTRTMTNLRNTCIASSATAPWSISYDPTGARYGQQWVYVDPVNGTLTAAVGMIATTLSGAKAVAPASRPRTVTTAMQALYLQNRSLAAANGQAAVSRAASGARLVLAPGTHTGFAGTTVTSGVNVAEAPVRIIGDPDDPNPRANCIIRTGASAPVARIGLVRYQNVTIETASTFGLTDASTGRVWLDNVEVRGASGFENSTTWPIVTGAPAAGSINFYITRSRIWRLGVPLGNANRWPGLVRASEFSRRMLGTTFVRNRWIGKAEDGFTASLTQEGLGTLPVTDAVSLEDLVVAFNDMRFMRWAAITFSPASAAAAGISPQNSSQRRYLVLNNVFERISMTNNASDTTDAFFNWGESSYSVMDNIILEGNTFAGSGYNAFYNDPTPANLTDINTQTNITVRIRHANNATCRNASKQDDFSDPVANGIRVGLGPPESLKAGFRPACVGAWSVHFGCGMEAHVDFSRSGTFTNFRRDGGSGFVGLRGVQYAIPTTPGYADDRSENGTDVGGGDYTPIGGSPLLGRITRANSDRDLAGAARLVNGATGALEALAGQTLMPDAAVSGLGSGMPQLDSAITLAAASALMGQRAVAGLVSIAFTLAASGARHLHTAGAAEVAWLGALQPAGAVSLSRVGEASLDTAAGGALLSPDAARLAWLSTVSVLFPDSGGVAGGTLCIPADLRLLTIF
jgi:hypothetical protein